MSIAIYIVLPMVLSILSLVAVLVAKVFFKNKSKLSIMLLGIAIMLLGGIFAVDPSTNLEGIEYLVVFLGLAFVFGGFAKKEI